MIGLSSAFVSMPRGYHTGNRIARGRLPLWLSEDRPRAVTILAMPQRVSPKKPVPVYLAAWREHRGLTQQDVGDRFDPPVDKATVSRWETDRRGLSLNVLAAYAEALEIQPPQLYHPPSEQESLDELVARAPKRVQKTVRDVVGTLIRGERRPRR